MSDPHRIVCVSNRLPVSGQETSEGILFHPSSGGLVTAMGPVLRKSRGVWIGWPGALDAEEEDVHKSLAKFSSDSEFELFPVLLDQEEVSGFYDGFSNGIIWPLFHDLQSRCHFEPEFWSTYRKVQDIFCGEVTKHIKNQDLIWVHDYHLMGLGKSLREAKVKNKICFFFHTPFPSSDIFLKLPWREEVMESMLSYDLIGFQTLRDLDNFADCLELLTPTKCSGAGSLVTARTPEKTSTLGHFPISIDFNEIEEIALLDETELHAQKIREDMNIQFLVLSIDRLDYTKGIPFRIKAFKRLLEIQPELKKRIALLQVVVPSRVEVLEYQQLRSEIEQLVTQVNGEFAEPGWVPVHHLFRSLTREEVISMYRAADIALVTPLKDGMNLVCKEYCATRIHNNGVLILSEFAGAADEFKDLALLVNPYDIDGVAEALLEGLKILHTSDLDRMQKMRSIIKKSDVFSWASSFLHAAGWEWPSYDSQPRPKTVWERVRKITNVFDI